ncbi:MAG TPA: hypothetical protein VEO01_19595 [Pseudonocardiaceae bacterium]|nr:hypothetical protein [Pseudonocardiaceae bacterium]
MSTVTFPKITHQEKRTVVCPGCDRKRTITRSDYMTVSPFNVDRETGEPRTPKQIREALVEQGALWTPSGPELWHQKCWDALDGGESS